MEKKNILLPHRHSSHIYSSPLIQRTFSPNPSPFTGKCTHFHYTDSPHPLVILIGSLAQWGGKRAGITGCGGEDISYPGQLWIHWWGAPLPQEGRCMALKRF